MIADDPRKPFDPSGIRFGTPAITTRGFTEKECTHIAEYMLDAIEVRESDIKLREIREKVRTLARAFPIPEEFI